MPSRYNSHTWLGISLAVACLSTEVLSFNSAAIAVSRSTPSGLVYASSDDDSGEQNIDDAVASNNADASMSPEAVTLDEGGVNLTDRFKYKVHALMGSFDPPSGAVDDENQTGNILGAMLEFPTEYTFTVVGRNEIDNNNQSEDGKTAGDNYATEVKKVLGSVLGSDAKMEVRVVPRGKKFTRVSAKVDVESASVISSIYNELGALEATVMKF